MFVPFSVIFLWISLFDCINSQYGYQYDSICRCTSISWNGNVCLQYTCNTKPRVGAYFPGPSFVTAEDDLRKSLSNLTIGERALVVSDENKLIYEPIYTFMHLKRNELFSFLSINIQYDDDTTSLFITPNHLIFLANDTTLNSAVFAGQLQVNDCIKYIYQNKIISAKIQSIYLIKEEGYYAPLTSSGTIVIDNVLVSNYATVSNHCLAHRIMKVYRWWIWLFGSEENNENAHWILRTTEIIVQWYGIEKFGPNSFYNGVFQVSGFI